MSLRGLLLVFAVPLLGGASEIPEPVLPAGVGVNIHFVTGHKPDLDLIAAAGFKVVRMDSQWDAIEASKGEYDWSAYDELLANLESRRLRALFILDYGRAIAAVHATSPAGQVIFRLATSYLPTALSTLRKCRARRRP